MTALSSIVNFITTYIFNQPFILLSLVAMLGLILQKKRNRRLSGYDVSKVRLQRWNRRLKTKRNVLHCCSNWLRYEEPLKA